MMDMSQTTRSWGVELKTSDAAGQQATQQAAHQTAHQAAQGSGWRARWDFPGFGPLTRVETLSGAFPAQTLRVGDRVRTRRGGFAEIRWLDRIVLDEAFLHQHPEAQPVLIAARTLGRGMPRRDIVLSPGQKISCEGLMMSRGSRTAGDLRQARMARRKTETVFTYTMFICAEPVEVRVEGLWVKLEPPRW